MSSRKKGWYWPYAIVASIIFIVISGGLTIMVAVQHPVEMSDMDLQNYHHYDKNANDIINAKIAFDKKYTIVYDSVALEQENAVVKYKVTHKDGAPVEDAKINIMLTRPDNHNNDMPFEKPNDVNTGIYSFNVGKLPLSGRWNIIAEIFIGDDVRYYSLKADTRYPNVFEY